MRFTSMASIAMVAILSLAVGSAQAQLSISPGSGDQNQNLQLQPGAVSDGGDDNAQLSATSIQVSQSAIANMDVQNSHLDDVDPNASVIFEVPIKIDTDGTYPDTYDNYVQVQGGLAEKTVDRFGLHCYVTTEDVYYTPGATKVIHLDANGDYEGSVRVGVPIKDDSMQNPDGTPREWQCYISPIYNRYMLPTSIVGGGAFNEREAGNLQ